MGSEAFLLSDVPGDVALVFGGMLAVGFSGCAVAIAALWTENKALKAELRANADAERKSYDRFTRALEGKSSVSRRSS